MCRRSLRFFKNKSPAKHVEACVDGFEDRGSTPLASTKAKFAPKTMPCCARRGWFQRGNSRVSKTKREAFGRAKGGSSRSFSEMTSFVTSFRPQPFGSLHSPRKSSFGVVRADHSDLFGGQQDFARFPSSVEQLDFSAP